MISLRSRGALVLLFLTLFALTRGLHLTAGRPERVPDSDAEELAEDLHLQWVRTLPQPRPAWPDQPKMPFDAVDRPAAAGHLVYVPSSATDRVTAFDARTGERRWVFHTEGPVRFAPVPWNDRVFVASDDGHLYALDALDGRLLWKVRGGPSGRAVLGNGRLISTWPVRGGPAVADGVVYFAAGIWPFMGIFVHAVEARTGRSVWTNDGDGSIYIKQPHQTDAYAGVAPQGSLVVSGDYLLVPGGRSVPACLDRRTGRLLHYRLGDNSKVGGGSEVCAGNGFYFNGGAAYDLVQGDHLGTVGEPTILSGGILYSQAGSEVRALDLQQARIKAETFLDRKGVLQKKRILTAPRVGGSNVTRVEVLHRSGTRIYGGRLGELFAIDLPLRASSGLAWRASIEGTPLALTVGEGRLFATTREGKLYCFGEEAGEPRFLTESGAGTIPTDSAAPRAAEILTQTGVTEGYAVVWGDGALAQALALSSKLHVLLIEADPVKAFEWREHLVALGIEAGRMAVLNGDPDSLDLPPYLASLVVCDNPSTAGIDDIPSFLDRVSQVMRPFGGVAVLGPEFSEASKRFSPPWETRTVNGATLVTRVGPIPGTADWTHEHADAANTRVSRDRVVKAPLGLLWFGGPPNEGVLPRHGHGPQPQVLDGRLFLEGVDMMRAVDIYTGRLLWEVSLPGVGKTFDNLAHQPGANASGSNYVSTREGIYIAYHTRCLCLDPATGRTLREFSLPDLPGTKGPPTWDHINVVGDLLIAGVNPPLPEARGRPPALSSSRHLFVMDRHEGRILWQASARAGFRHNTLCAGGGRLYAIDRPSVDHLARLERRGLSSTTPRLVAFDLANGHEVWSSTEGIFGTWLSYSVEHDVLVEAGRVARDTLTDEPKGMRAYTGRTGAPLWYHKDYVGPAMIHGERVLKDRSACDLRTGAPILREDPLTGASLEWSWMRTYGCNTPMASEHLLTFRSGAAGYFDLCRDAGTSNLGGFRSGCTNNLVVAGGLLCAPDYTRTCTCSYQNQTSVALVPTSDGEQWSYFGPRSVPGRVRRVGINLGAPGNRKDDTGTLWLEHPTVGGPSPQVPVRVEPATVRWFRRHESRVSGEGHSWVAASGAEGIQTLTITLATHPVPEIKHTVRLIFLEPERLSPGQRVFDVALQGNTVLEDLDVVREAGGSHRALVKEFSGILVGQELRVAFTPQEGSGMWGPVLSGIEVLAEGR